MQIHLSITADGVKGDALASLQVQRDVEAERQPHAVAVLDAIVKEVTAVVEEYPAAARVSVTISTWVGVATVEAPHPLHEPGASMPLGVESDASDAAVPEAGAP